VSRKCVIVKCTVNSTLNLSYIIMYHNLSLNAVYRVATRWRCFSVYWLVFPQITWRVSLIASQLGDSVRCCDLHFVPDLFSLWISHHIFSSASYHPEVSGKVVKLTSPVFRVFLFDTVRFFFAPSFIWKHTYNTSFLKSWPTMRHVRKTNCFFGCSVATLQFHPHWFEEAIVPRKLFVMYLYI